MKDIVYKFLVIILVVINIYLLFIINTSAELKNKPMIEPPLLNLNSNIRLDSLDIFNSGSLHLFLYIDEEGCLNCILNELRNIDKFSKDWNNYVTIILKAENESFIERFDISPIRINLVSKGSKFLANFNNKNPIAFVVDRNKTMQSINLAESGNPGKSNRFYERTISLFSTVYK